MKHGNLYIIQHGTTHYYKIGITIDTIFSRIAELQTGNPITLRPILEKSFHYITLAEDIIHQKYWYQRELGEWFWFDPGDEKHPEFIENVVGYIKNKLELDVQARIGLIGDYLKCPYCNNTLPNSTLYDRVVTKGFCSRCNPRNKYRKIPNAA